VGVVLVGAGRPPARTPRDGKGREGKGREGKVLRHGSPYPAGHSGNVTHGLIPMGTECRGVSHILLSHVP
jgi:hypothetical protein